MRLGIIARSDNTGLGNQTRELVKMLNPDKILLIDSQHFNGNEQHPEWYKDYNVTTTSSGFPGQREVIEFLRDIDLVLSCETFYRQDFLHYAKRREIKTILQYNFEFLLNMSIPEAELKSKPQVNDFRFGKCFEAIAVIDPESIPPLKYAPNSTSPTN